MRNTGKFSHNSREGLLDSEATGVNTMKSRWMTGDRGGCRRIESSC